MDHLRDSAPVRYFGRAAFTAASVEASDAACASVGTAPLAVSVASSATPVSHAGRIVRFAARAVATAGARTGTVILAGADGTTGPGPAFTPAAGGSSASTFAYALA